VSFDHLKNLFPEIEYPQKMTSIEAATNQSLPANLKSLITPNYKNSAGVSVMVFGRKIAIKLPKDELDTHFILGIRYSRWDGKQYCWTVPNYPGNLDLIKDYFKERISELIINEEIETTASNHIQRKISKDDLLVIKTATGRLKLFFGYNKELTNAIKKIPYSNWNGQNKWWSIPFANKFLEEIKVIVNELKLHLIYEEEENDTHKTARISQFDIPNYRKCPDEFILKLKELRYSEHTIKTYKALFEEFINYYHKLDINRIDESMITSFLRYLVIERKVSTSYQNQAINAVKFYYERVLGGQRHVYLVDRPREEKTLPIVLSEKEVGDLLKATENIKHKAILMLAYSGGLRLSELINVKITDIDSNRMQIRVEQGKGKKDRYTLLSVRLLENGTDLRYIQSLLGHASSKTTEIYTHITTKGFDQIKSPLDNLDIFQ
jgi:integrase/recombinase XerD